MGALWISLIRLQPSPPDPDALALALTEVRKKVDGSKSEVSQEDTASEAEVNTEEPLNGDEGEEEGLARDECEDELVREAGYCVPPAKRIQQRTTILPELVKPPQDSSFLLPEGNCCI